MSLCKCSICRPKHNFVTPKYFISNSFFNNFIVFLISLGDPMIFRSSTYTAIIVKLEIYRLIKTHGLIILYLYHSFMRYSLSRLYHIRPDYFSPYNDCFNFIEYISRYFDLNASDIFNPSRTFI
jgi:hypothetical protein